MKSLARDKICAVLLNKGIWLLEINGCAFIIDNSIYCWQTCAYESVACGIRQTEKSGHLWDKRTQWSHVMSLFAYRFGCRSCKCYKFTLPELQLKPVNETRKHWNDIIYINGNGINSTNICKLSTRQWPFPLGKRHLNYFSESASQYVLNLWVPLN